VQLIASFLAVTIIITLHEFSHAFVAYKCGDPTAKWNGRMTLNPFKHFDPLGIVMMVLVGFGWAKPVPVNPNNFRKYKSGCFWTSAAGIITNYISAFLFCPLYLLILKYLGSSSIANTYGYIILESFTYYLFAYSLNFCVFNLLPFYPLDGFRMIDALSKKRGKVYRFLRVYGHYILLGLIFLSFVAERLSTVIPFFGYLDILGYVMFFATNILGYPITKLWTLIIF
jgi:Zn-dependent protease